MASEESFLVLVHYKGTIKKKIRSGIKFTDNDPLSVFIRASTSLVDFQNTILQKLRLQGMKQIENLYFRISISVVRDGVKYDSFVIDSDKNLQVLLHYRCQFFEVRMAELLAKLVDVVSNSGVSNRNYQSIPMAAASSSTPVVASSSLPVMTTVGDLVASPSFAVDLHHDENAKIGANMNTPVMILILRKVGVLDAVEDLLGDDDEVEPAMIDDESDDDIGRSIPVGAGGASSSRT
ncbi:uncharacterized protein LOC110269290 [Arachis ipaensis]|uniref:uncharacterized protein LOC110269290 n=1 Tax=Arachis ipaensis TaxID=130454 RepID=UPI000A2AFCCE|nr:uncharacterized protein LOC110269290 [Arachis ipaensis]